VHWHEDESHAAPEAPHTPPQQSTAPLTMPEHSEEQAAAQVPQRQVARAWNSAGPGELPLWKQPDWHAVSNAEQAVKQSSTVTQAVSASHPPYIALHAPPGP
jgi:hypothetical protein